MISVKKHQEPHIYTIVGPTRQFKSRKWNKKNQSLEYVTLKPSFTYLVEKKARIFCIIVKDIISRSKNGNNCLIYQDRGQKEKLFVFQTVF